VLSKLKTEKDGQIAWSIITKKQYESIPNPDQEARSIVAEMQNLIGIKISILFVEKEEEKIKISFRSKEGYPVDKIAEDLGGGGHKLASGCTITGQDKKSLIANVISLCNNILLSAEN
jgi:phosphoesterase RecJ-like protein